MGKRDEIINELQVDSIKKVTSSSDEIVRVDNMLRYTDPALDFGSDPNNIPSAGWIDNELSGKADLSGATFTGDVTAPTFIGNLSGTASTAEFADQAGVVDTIEGKIIEGDNISITGGGTDEDPFVISSTGGVTIATDAELQTQTTPVEDNKIVSRHGLIFWWNWLRTQVLEFTKVVFGPTTSANAHATFAPSTNVSASLNIKPSTDDYTGDEPGALTNNQGELKFLDGTSQVRIVKTSNNELFKNSIGAIFSVSANQEGDILIAHEEIEEVVWNEDIIDAIVNADYVFDKAEIDVIDKTLYSGQEYFDEDTNTYYQALEDNKVLRTRHNQLGWISYTDSIHTTGSPLVINESTTQNVGNNGSVKVDVSKPFGVTDFVDISNGNIQSNNLNDNLLVNLRLKARSSSNTGLMDIKLNVPTLGIIVEQTVSMRKGIGVTQSVNILFDVYVGAAFLANKAQVQITSITGDTEIFDVFAKVTRTIKGG